MSAAGDAFALLGLPRAAALSADAVRLAFKDRAAAVHPDHAADEADRLPRSAAFAALNEAQLTLRSTARRLRHLLDLEWPALAASRAGAAMDDAAMSLFGSVAHALRLAEAAARRRDAAASALVRAMAAGDVMAAADAVSDALAAVEEAAAAMEDNLVAIDAARAAGEACGPALMAAAARAGFLEKWQGQLRQAFAGLA